MQSPAVDPPTGRTQFAERDHRPCFKNTARRSTRLVSAFVLLTLGFAAVNLNLVAVHAQASNDDFPDVDKIMPKRNSLFISYRYRTLQGLIIRRCCL